MAGSTGLTAIRVRVIVGFFRFEFFRMVCPLFSAKRAE
jgi:hypothetical protein